MPDRADPVAACLASPSRDHAAAVSLHFMHYNFVRRHQTLGTTPACAGGVADHVWKLSEIIDLLEQAEVGFPRTRGPYKKRAA